MIQALSFDLDDTLWPVRPVILRADRAQWRWIEARYPEVPRGYDWRSMMALRDEVIEAFPDSSYDLTFIRRECLRRVALREGINDTDQFSDGAFAAFEAERNRVWFYADALPALARLARDYRLIAVTNGNASLELTGIAPWFEHALTARSVGAAKPDRRMFDAATSALSLSAHEILHLGDSPELDAQAALDAGQHALWINRTGASWPTALGTQPPTLPSLATLDRQTIERVYA